MKALSSQQFSCDGMIHTYRYKATFDLLLTEICYPLFCAIALKISEKFYRNF